MSRDSWCNSRGYQRPNSSSRAEATAESRNGLRTEAYHPLKYPGQLPDAGLLTIPLQLHPLGRLYARFLVCTRQGLVYRELLSLLLSSTLEERGYILWPDRELSSLFAHSFIHLFIHSSLIRGMS